MNDRPQGVRLTMDELLEQYAPRDYEEAAAAARAVATSRDDEAAYGALEALTEFERQLAAEAYHAGREEMRAAVLTAIGSAAATLNASTLRDAIETERHHHGRDFRRGSHRPEDLPRMGPADLRAARLVQSARRTADHLEARQETRP